MRKIVSAYTTFDLDVTFSHCNHDVISIKLNFLSPAGVIQA
jgi:hypothetical protein